MPLQSFLTGPANSIGKEKFAANRLSLDEFFSPAYEELCCLASSVKRGRSSSTLSKTALVNEAWIKLARSPGVDAESLLHFKRIARLLRSDFYDRGNLMTVLVCGLRNVKWQPKMRHCNPELGREAAP
jgi:hypothetical protein